MGGLTDLVYLTDGRRHLICRPFSIEGLHRMAEDLGIKRCWFHGGRRPHYDVPSRRRIEIESRCMVVTSREIVEIIAANERGVSLAVSLALAAPPVP